jgi:hypothetical protein
MSVHATGQGVASRVDHRDEEREQRHPCHNHSNDKSTLQAYVH